MGTRKKAVSAEAIARALFGPLLSTAADGAQLAMDADAMEQRLAEDDVEQAVRRVARARLVAALPGVLAALCERALKDNTAAKLFCELAGLGPLPAVATAATAEADMSALERSVVMALRAAMRGPVTLGVEEAENFREENESA